MGVSPRRSPAKSGGIVLEARGYHALHGRAHFIEERIGHLVHASLETLRTDQAQLRDDGRNLSTIVGKDEVVGSAFRLRREWHDEHHILIEFPNDQDRALKEFFVAVFLRADVHSE